MSTDKLHVDLDKKVQILALKVPNNGAAFIKFGKEFHSRAIL